MIGINQVEAYEGGIGSLSSPRSDTIGTIYEYQWFLKNSEPPKNSFVDIRLLDKEGTSLDEFSVPVDDNPSMIDGVDKVWLFNFSIDTGKYDLLTDVEYTVQAQFEDQTKDRRLFVYPSLEQSVIDTGNAKSNQETSELIQEPIPDWVKKIFIFYANGDIGDSDLINAIQYLIDIKILKV